MISTRSILHLLLMGSVIQIAAGSEQMQRGTQKMVDTLVIYKESAALKVAVVCCFGAVATLGYIGYKKFNQYMDRLFESQNNLNQEIQDLTKQTADLTRNVDTHTTLLANQIKAKSPNEQAQLCLTYIMQGIVDNDLFKRGNQADLLATKQLLEFIVNNASHFENNAQQKALYRAANMCLELRKSLQDSSLNDNQKIKLIHDNVFANTETNVVKAIAQAGYQEDQAQQVFNDDVIKATIYAHEGSPEYSSVYKQWFNKLGYKSLQEAQEHRQELNLRARIFDPIYQRHTIFPID